MQGDKHSLKQSPQGDLHAYLGWKITQQGTHEIGALYSKHVQVNLNFLDNTVMQDLPMFTQSVEPRCGAVESGSLLRIQPKVKRHSRSPLLSGAEAVHLENATQKVFRLSDPQVWFRCTASVFAT
jgi:hypothetical protein